MGGSKKKTNIGENVVATYSLWLGRTYPELYDAGVVYNLLEDKKFPDEASLADYVINLASLIGGELPTQFSEYVEYEREVLKGNRVRVAEKELWKMAKDNLKGDFPFFERYNIFPLFFKVCKSSFKGTEIEALFTAMRKFPLEWFSHNALAELQLHLAEEEHEGGNKENP